MKSVKKRWVTILIVAFVIIGIFAAISDDKPKTEVPAQEAVEVTQTTEPTYSLPDQGEFLNYVKEQFNSIVASGTLDLDTILIDPVEIEVREYKLNSSGKPDISMTAWVKEMTLGVQGNEITATIVKITLKWVTEQGFNPQKDWIMPICSIMRREYDDNDQAMVRVFGRSTYDPNTDSIDWSPAK
jgi:hypothetical protein